MNRLQRLHPCPTRPSSIEQVLGGSAIADAQGAPDWPEQTLHMTGFDAPWREAWGVAGDIDAGQHGDVLWRANQEVMFALVELEEPSGSTAKGAGEALRALTERAYGQLFDLMATQGTPHLWRVWNYLPDINAEADGLERYRWFNLGRHQAYDARGTAVAQHAPAASALGSAGGPLSIACLAGRHPPRAIENPRQVSAYHYPDQYGPRPPVFARAVLAGDMGQPTLFVSGTASIVGHETVHAGDVLAQCAETARNLNAVFAEASHAGGGHHYLAHQAEHRVYVRHSNDVAAVRAFLTDALQGAPLALVQADVCRQDLLVEVESVANPAR
ncbi:MAG: hypothetical protein KF871_08470 [Hydrogenophaga sp.]|uniref:chorismate transformation enzyme, FkbO/Hyg5 family n=1 Tax=Hydrogenophaga sp. TaxID=1904254 RepID=UPI001D67BCAD|nr:hypothetical protein [Hydrogenophaga sp.]MBX3609919.1 hypothetical protein [Hydrogenophaga sp.]